MLRNANGGGVSNFLEKALRMCKVQHLLLVLRGGGGDPIPRKKRNVTLEWPCRMAYPSFHNHGAQPTIMIFIVVNNSVTVRTHRFI